MIRVTPTICLRIGRVFSRTPPLSSSVGVEEYRLHENIATSGHAVGRYRPAGLASTTITYRAPTNAPVVALTFDDGPSDRYTDRLLNILDGLDIPATFFLIGEHVM